MTGSKALAIGAMCGVLCAPVFGQATDFDAEAPKRAAFANGSIEIPFNDDAIDSAPAESKPASEAEPESFNTDSAEASKESSKPPAIESQPLGAGSATPLNRSDSGGLGSVKATSAVVSSVSEFGKVAGALAAVIGLAFAARTILRRAGAMSLGESRPSGVVQILARYPVPGLSGQQLIVIKVGRRIVLAHASGTTMTSLSEMSDTDEVACMLSRLEAGADARTAGKFRQTLSEFQAEHHTQRTRESERLIPSQRDGAQVVDLTRSNGRGLLGLFGGRRSA